MISKRTVLTAALLATACSDHPEKSAGTVKVPETPRALQEKTIDLRSSYSQRYDLTEALYRELTAGDTALKSLENLIDSVKRRAEKCRTDFTAYDSKSSEYYTSANQTANTIQDSILKQKILALTAESIKKYAAESKELKSCLAEIGKNSTAVSDHHTALKIILTLPVIEKYQSENRPDLKVYMKSASEQKDAVRKIDSLSAKAK